MDDIQEEFEHLIEMKPSIHYDFVHQKLRSVCFMNSLSTLEKILISEEKREEYLTVLLEDLYRKYSIEAENSMSYQDMEFSIDEVRGENAIFIRMPEPKDWSEAFFVAVVFKKPSAMFRRKRPGEVQYFILEKGRTESSTVLCRWDNNRHINLGEGPEPVLEEFKKSIKKFIK